MFHTHKGLLYADQDILNILLRDKWLAGDIRYNFQISARFGLYGQNMHEQSSTQEQLCQNPAIIHYTGKNKAWLNHKPIWHAERWWFYSQLTWQEIKDKWQTT